MLFLPPIMSNECEWRLPVAPSTIQQLGVVALADSVDERRRQLHKLLPADPSVTVWAACRINLNCSKDIFSVNTIVDRLAELFIRELQWASGEDLHGPETKSNGYKVEHPEIQAWAPWEPHHQPLASNTRQRCEDLKHDCTTWLKACRVPTVSFPDDNVEQVILPGSIPISDFAGGSEQNMPLSEEDHDSLPQSHSVVQAHEKQWWNQLHKPSGLKVDHIPSLLAKLARLEKLETDFDKTLQHEKLESLRELAYGASHEINNPLANISSRAQTLLRDEESPARRRMLATINNQAFRAHEMISDMMLFAKPPPLNPEPLDAIQLIDQVLEEVAADATTQGTSLENISSQQQVLTMGDPRHLSVALRALCQNSLNALVAGGSIKVSATLRKNSDASNGTVELSVWDSGEPLSDEVRRHLFDPFYSGREAGRGLGFGLSKSWRIAELHGGNIEVDDKSDAGVKFTLFLPTKLPVDPLQRLAS